MDEVLKFLKENPTYYLARLRETSAACPPLRHHCKI